MVLSIFVRSDCMLTRSTERKAHNPMRPPDENLVQ